MAGQCRLLGRDSLPARDSDCLRGLSWASRRAPARSTAYSSPPISIPGKHRGSVPDTARGTDGVSSWGLRAARPGQAACNAAGGSALSLALLQDRAPGVVALRLPELSCTEPPRPHAACPTGRVWLGALAPAREGGHCSGETRAGRCGRHRRSASPPAGRLPPPGPVPAGGAVQGADPPRSRERGASGAVQGADRGGMPTAQRDSLRQFSVDTRL